MKKQKMTKEEIKNRIQELEDQIDRQDNNPNFNKVPVMKELEKLRKKIEKLEKPKKAFQVVTFENGKFGVIDTQNEITVVKEDGTKYQAPYGVAFGMTEQQAEEFADRHNLRRTWGI